MSDVEKKLKSIKDLGLDQEALEYMIGSAVLNAFKHTSEYGDGGGTDPRTDITEQSGKVLVAIDCYEGFINISIYKLVTRTGLIDQLHPFVEKCLKLYQKLNE